MVAYRIAQNLISLPSSSGLAQQTRAAASADSSGAQDERHWPAKTRHGETNASGEDGSIHSSLVYGTIASRAHVMVGKEGV